MSTETQTQSTYLKRPSNAYIHYSNANRDKVKAANSELSHKEVIRKLASLWNKHKEKNSGVFLQFTDIANSQKLQFENSIKENPSLVKPNKPRKQKTKKVEAEPVVVAKVDETPVSKPSKTKKDKVKVDVVVPPVETSTETTADDKKRKPSGYSVFTKQARKEIKEGNPSLSGAEVNAEISKRWKELSDEEKLTWKPE